MGLARRSFTLSLISLGSLAGWLIVTSPDVTGQVPQCLGASADVVGDPDGDGVINGDDNPNVIVGTEAGEKINGGGGDDRICGLGGDDTIKGDAGFDRVSGGPGNDTCDTERQIGCETVTGEDPAPAPEPAPPTTSSTVGKKK